MINTLKLILALIKQDKSETSMIGKEIGEQKQYALVRQLIKIVKQGPSINYCSFDNKVNYFAISLLRAFLGYCSKTK